MGGRRVFVGGLRRDVTERDLDRFFRDSGRIREVVLKNGYAFVEFDDDRDAEDAVYDMNGQRLLGEKVTVEFARGVPRSSFRSPSTSQRSERNRPVWADKYGVPQRTNYRLRVENLSSRVSWQDLKDIMRRYGEVTYADAHRKDPNEGVVDFASKTDMKNALTKMDGEELHGRKIRLVELDSAGRVVRQSSSRSRSRSRSRKRSASRSRSRNASRSRSRSASKSASPNRSPHRSPNGRESPEND